MRPAGASPMPVTRVPPQDVAKRSMVISERVRVPVLSVQIADAEPSVSIDASFFTIALRFAMRWTPIASTTESLRPEGLQERPRPRAKRRAGARQ